MISESTSERFGLALRHALERNGMKGQALAKELSVSPSAVSEWLAGRNMPRPEKWNQLSNLLGINISEILNDPRLNTETLNTDPENLTDTEQSKVRCHGYLSETLDAAGADIVKIHWVLETLRQTFPKGLWKSKM